MWRERQSFPLSLVLAGVLFLSACGEKGGNGQNDNGNQGPVAVEAMTIKTADIAIEDVYSGRTAGSLDAIIKARVEGTLIERPYSEGAKVKADDVLFEIDPEPFEAAMEEAEAALLQAQITLRSAERTWERARDLYANKNISEQRRDDAYTTREVAIAGVALANSRVHAARINLDYTTVRAPFDGVTGTEIQSVGNLVGSTPENSDLTRLTRLDPLYVDFSIPDESWLMLQRLLADGQLIKSVDGPLNARLETADGRMHAAEGRVDFTAATIDPTTGTVKARAVVPNPDHHLLPGQFVRVHLGGLTRPDAIVIPQTAVMQDQNGAYVYRIDAQNIAQRAAIQTGPLYQDGWIIDSGLKAGDQIVTKGLLRVRPGQLVAPETTDRRPSSAPVNATEKGSRG
jgi:membrane fusion protein (multidrug efflux system)